MKRRHLLRVEHDAEAFRPLVEALHAAGHRSGWLDLEAAPEPPESLAAAASLPFLRAVAVGDGRAVAHKPIAGPPVLRDLLAEHFAGCRLVLLRGAGPDLPLLKPDGEAWRLTLPDGGTRQHTTATLTRALARPHPWK